MIFFCTGFLLGLLLNMRFGSHSHLDWIIAEDPVCKFNLFNLHSLINMHQNNWQVKSLLLLGCRFSLMTVIFHQQQFKVAAYWSAIVFGKLLPAFLLSPPSLGCVSWEVADCLHNKIKLINRCDEHADCALYFKFCL